MRRAGLPGRVLKAAMFFAALVCAPQSPALDVEYDGRTLAALREWADKYYVREQMEVLGAKICKALYGDAPRSKLHENFKITLYLTPTKGGNPAFASGRRITWKVGANPGGEASGGMGLLCHEMTHILDMGSDGTFTEAMADWVRNYKVFYPRCTSPTAVLDKRYKALRGSRRYGKYISGANFIDFMTQNYGEGTIYRILQGYAQHKGKVWEELFGKPLDGLVEDWRRMETIYDPVFQWTYDATAAGKVRYDGSYCGLRSISAADDPGKAGAWLNGATAGKVSRCENGNLSLALHGRFPKTGRTAIASIGSAKEGSGKALLLATSSKSDILAAHVIATVPGKGCQIVSTTQIPVPRPGPSSVPGSGLNISHSIILTVKGGDAAAVLVDGKPLARIDMKTKCGGCVFTPAFAVGGMSGGFGVSGFAEPRGEGGVLLDDFRVFTRTFRSRETELYARTFGAGYQGAVAVYAEWTGPQGSSAIDDIGNWYCVNSSGERVFVLPLKETDVSVRGKALPSIPPKSKFACKSFTIDGWAVADAADIDLRGVRIVDLANNTRLITRNGRRIALNAVRCGSVRLDGTLAVSSGMKISGNLEMKQGSVLRLPEDPKMVFAKSISVKGDGPVALKPGTDLKNGGYHNVMRLEEMPEDMSKFRVDLKDAPGEAAFKAGTGGKFLGVSTRMRK